MSAAIQKHICHSIKGIHKNENQDDFVIFEAPDYNLYVIFDGVGCAINCKQATIFAKEFLKHHYLQYIGNTIQIDRLMHECNRYILSLGIPDMLTTYCTVYIPTGNNDQVIYSSLGDSRIYIIANQHIEQITKDDRLGESKNVITKCLGMDLPASDFTQAYIEKGNASILLCTDGFYNFMEKSKMQFFDVFSKASLKAIKENLERCISHKNIDDSTYLFIR